ncbi:hypothetical protein T01_15087 [Trichinella spiralis]|uniref:Uncharacterized protein n=1 Tax=Trichinella spiralis TaxID=6334 RepID=A0A0V1BSL6_TRISP|nr:hypothetical protein T01_15087 [Trichinella spiralis]
MKIKDKSYASTNSGGQTSNAEKIVLEVSILSLRDGNEHQNKTDYTSCSRPDFWKNLRIFI